MYRIASILLLVRYFILRLKGKSTAFVPINFVMIHVHTGVFEVVPSGRVLVCPGRQFNMTCFSNNSTFLQWNITIPHYNVTNTRVISASMGMLHHLKSPLSKSLLQYLPQPP